MTQIGALFHIKQYFFLGEGEVLRVELTYKNRYVTENKHKCQHQKEKKNMYLEVIFQMHSVFWLWMSYIKDFQQTSTYCLAVSTRKFAGSYLPYKNI